VVFLKITQQYLFMKNWFTYIFIALLANLICFSTFAQDYPYALPQYKFIRYDKNELKNVASSDYFENILKKLNRIYSIGKGKINIVNIGDSHIQADIFTNRIRQRFQNFIPGAYGGLGYIFPYNVLRTNNPISYYTITRGKWIGKTNIKNHPGLKMGVGGIAIKTIDPKAIIKIKVRKEDDKNQTFNKVTVFYVPDTNSFDFTLKAVDIFERKDYADKGYTEFYLKNNVDEFSFQLIKNKATQNHFVLNGFSVETSYTGIEYHKLGINGATVPDWLNCSLLNKQLEGLHPDMFVISLGTNDAYDTNFDSTFFANSCRKFIHSLQSYFPDIPVIVTTPGDHYRYKHYLNYDNAKAVAIINSLAIEMGFAVWDYNEIMGGQNSIALWVRDSLARHDYVHYTKTGYMLQGDLFFTAFLKEWDKFIDENKHAHLAENNKL